MKTRLCDFVRGVRVRVKGGAAMDEGVLAGGLPLARLARSGSVPQGRIRSIGLDSQFKLASGRTLQEPALTSGGAMFEAAAPGRPF